MVGFRIPKLICKHIEKINQAQTPINFCIIGGMRIVNVFGPWNENTKLLRVLNQKPNGGGLISRLEASPMKPYKIKPYLTNTPPPYLGTESIVIDGLTLRT